MTKLELAVIDNYIEWLETPKNRKLKLKLNNIKGAFLLKEWQKEKKLNKYQAQEEIAKLIMAVLYSEDGGVPIKLKLIEPILDDGKGCMTKLHPFGDEKEEE